MEAEGAEVPDGADGSGFVVGRRGEGLGPGEANHGFAGRSESFSGALDYGGGAPEKTTVARHPAPVFGRTGEAWRGLTVL